MGVPTFFKWLTIRYPKILIDAREKPELDIKLNEINMNNSLNNETIPEIDNLYFDMNGIIHPCFHPENGEAPSSFQEIFNNIFAYCDRLIKIIKPKKLIYMAIDGVAPRAKMNQQRSRRFSSASAAEQSKRISSFYEKQWKDKGLPYDFLVKKDNKNKFDSNIITPGTDFLNQCSIALRTYIKSRINNDPLWSKLNVIFSDASVPGEGEHKILDYIRTQRTYENYDPNTSHCIYGADADLIMLSLIMHEPHFCVIRESINDTCEICGKSGHKKEECKNKGKYSDKNKNSILKKIKDIEFSLIKIDVLREYLELEFIELIEKKI